jgi:hypothetical protein
MTPEEATTAAQFLQRVTLQPSEIPAFQQIMQALQGEVEAAQKHTVVLEDSDG